MAPRPLAHVENQLSLLVLEFTLHVIERRLVRPILESQRLVEQTGVANAYAASYRRAIVGYPLPIDYKLSAFFRVKDAVLRMYLEFSA